MTPVEVVAGATASTRFRRSSRCDSATCVEVAIGDQVLVRNSTEPELVAQFTRDQWGAFLAAVEAGEFSL